VANCQIDECQNHGVHSCSGCGKLFCGAHGQLKDSWGNLDIRCSKCISQIQAADRKAGRKGLGVGCLGTLIGVVILAVCIPAEAWLGVAIGAIILLGGLYISGLSLMPGSHG
jgi:hypothetical protein